MAAANLTFDLSQSTEAIASAAESALSGDLGPARALGTVEVLRALTISDAQSLAVKSAIEVAWADDDAPIFDTEEGAAIAKQVAELFGAKIAQFGEAV